jgi:hypothetical protein
MSDTPTDRYTELATKLAECRAEKIRLHRITDEMIERAVLALDHSDSDGSGFNKTWLGYNDCTDKWRTSSELAELVLRAALEVTDG